MSFRLAVTHHVKSPRKHMLLMQIVSPPSNLSQGCNFSDFADNWHLVADQKSIMCIENMCKSFPVHFELPFLCRKRDGEKGKTLSRVVFESNESKNRTMGPWGTARFRIGVKCGRKTKRFLGRRVKVLPWAHDIIRLLAQICRIASMDMDHVGRMAVFLHFCFYFVWKASKYLPLFFTQPQPIVVPVKGKPRLKTIHPGNHTNIPTIDTRNGKNGEDTVVHDPLFLQKSLISLTILPEERQSLCAEPGTGVEGERGNFYLTQIRDHIKSRREMSRTRLFCAIYTYSGHRNMTQAISETWGRRCDAILYASDVTSSTTGHFKIPTRSHNGYGYRGMIQRTRAILAYLYDNFLNDYDFFHVCGDDVYMIVETMKEFLESDEVKRWESVPGHYLFAGFWAHWGKMIDGYFYLGGGSGYTISKNGLKTFVEGPLQTCNPYQEGSAEDVWFSDCARLLSSEFIYTGDMEGGQRYHQGPIYDPVRYQIFRESISHSSRLTGIPSVPEENIISNSSVVFHRHYHPYELKRMELLLYGNFEEFATNDCYNNK